jgi:hypothetical protein
MERADTLDHHGIIEHDVAADEFAEVPDSRRLEPTYWQVTTEACWSRCSDRLPDIAQRPAGPLATTS